MILIHRLAVFFLYNYTYKKLMYKTAVYTLVNGAITHQKPQI